VFRPLRRSALLLAAVALLVVPASASANHSWGGYHWARTANPFTLKLGDNVSASWDAVLGTTSSDWSKSSVLDTTIVAGGAKPGPDGEAPEGYLIKGNKDSMKYHAPGGRWYDATIAEVWFRTEADAEAAGFVKAGSRASKAANEEADK